MKNVKHPIFQQKDPWFIRIMTKNAIPKKIAVKLLALKATGVLSFTSLIIIDEFLNYVPLADDKVSICTKQQLLQIINLIKSSVDLNNFKVMNGPWFVKLLGDKGIHDDDMTDSARRLVYEAMLHGYMMMLLEHEYKSNNIGKAHYSVSYLVYRCGYYCCSRYWSSYTVYYFSNTMLKLKGTFTQVKTRKVAHTELAQYYTYLFGFHTKLFVQTAKSINDFVFGELPQLDKKSVIDAAAVMNEVVTKLTEDLAITRSNIVKIETLIGTTTFAMTDIDNALVTLDKSVVDSLGKSKDVIAKQIASNSVLLDGKTGSISDLIIAQAKNQSKSFATMGMWMYEAFKDIREKEVAIKGIKSCSLCIPVAPHKAGAMMSGTFGFGMILGYAAKKAREVILKKRSASEIALAKERVENYDMEAQDVEITDINDI